MDFRAFEATPGISVIVLPDAPLYTHIAVSNDFLRASGKKKEEVVGKGHFTVFPQSAHLPDSRELAVKSSFEYVVRHKEKHEIPQVRYDIPEAGGRFTEKYWNLSSVPVLSDTGDLLYIIHTAVDVTEKVLAEKRIETVKGLEKANRLFMDAPVIIGIVRGEEQIFELANEGMLQVLGKSESIIGQPLHKVISREENQRFGRLIESVRQTGTPFHASESPFRVIKEGMEETLFFDFVFKPFYEEDTATPSGVICVAHDVTERVRGRRELEEVSERLNFRNALLEAQNEATPDGVLVVGPMGEILLYNQRFAEIWGMPEEVFRSNKDANALAHAMNQLKDPQGFIRRVEELYAARPAKSVDVIHFKDGRTIERHGTPIISPGGVYQGWAWYFRDITQRIRQEQKFKNVVQQAPDPILILKGEDMVLEVANEALFKIWKVDESAIGKAFLEILPEMKGQGFLELLQEVYRTGQPYQGFETPAVFEEKGGGERTVYFNFTYQPYREADGTISGVLVMATDVTGQVAARRQAEESQEELRLFKYMVENAQDSFYLTRQDGSFAYVNKKARESLGYSGEEMEKLRVPDIDPIYDKERFLESYQAARQPGGARFETIHRRKDGFLYPVEVNLDVLTYEGTTYLFGISRDISERKRSEESLRLFQYMVENAQDAFYLIHGDGSFAYINKKATELLGYTVDELKRMRVPDIDPFYDDDLVAGIFSRSKQETNIRFETLHRRKDGYVYPVEVNVGGLEFEGVPYMFAITREITDRKKAAEAISEQNMLINTLANNATSALFMMDAEGYCTFMNAAGEKMFGYSQEEIRQKPLHDLIHHHRPDGSFYPKAECPLDKALPENFDLRAHRDLFFRKDGTSFPVSCAASPIFKEGIPVSTVIEVRDITLEVEAEGALQRTATELEQLVQRRTGELEALNQQLEQFAYAASHDLQEPLRKISFFVERLQKSLGTSLNEGDQKMVERIQVTTGRMRKLIDDLLEFSKSTVDQMKFGDVHLGKLVSDVIGDMEAAVLQTGAKLLVTELPTIRGDERQLRQLFHNLISNALKYKKPDTTPVVSIGCSVVEMPVGISPATYWQIEVRDNGIGFHQEYADTIFQPFHRLHGKQEYEGTGIGLAIVKKVVDNHQGYISANGKLGEGACFRVLLPR